MQPHATTETNRTPEVEPAIKYTVPWRVTSVTALPDARLRVVLVDGTTGEVHMSQFLTDSKLNGTIFQPLRDPALFAQAQVVLGAVQWPNGADLRPMRCMTQSANMVSGSLANFGLTERANFT